MSERSINDTEALVEVLKAVGLAACGPLRDVHFEVFAFIDHERLWSWKIRLNLSRPDRDTGEMGRGTSRWELIEVGATESAVVKTVWVLCELAVKHELMEAFTYRGVRVFDPHHTVDELSMPAIARRGAAA